MRTNFLLTPDMGHRKVFDKIQIIAFQKGKSLKDILVIEKELSLKTDNCFSCSCNKPRCDIWKDIIKHFGLNYSSQNVYVPSDKEFKLYFRKCSSFF